MSRDKILSLAEAAARLAGARAAGEAVVLCHGCFDLVHPGHVRHLEHARRQGDRLIVSITGDALVDKGSGRPLIPQELRAENLAALHCVDWVVVNPAPTAVELLSTLRPDVYIKGREYLDNRDPRFEAEKRAVERYGGRLVFSSGDVVFSSTALIEAWEHTHDPARARIQPLLERERAGRAELDALIASFHGMPVVVAGETITDTYVMCDRPDVAAEGPLMTLRPIEERRYDGGAAIIAAHLAAMGAQVRLVTALGDDMESAAVVERLAAQRITVETVPRRGRALEKRRFLVGAVKMMRLELGDPVTLDAAGQARLVEATVAAARGAAALVVADYGQGLFSSTVMEGLCAAARPHVRVLAGDVSGRRASLLSMRGMDLLCPSELEVRHALSDYDGGLSTLCWRLLHETGALGAIVTVGPEGAIAVTRPPDTPLVEHDWQTRLAMDHVPALCGHPVDPLGCGDALLAAATLTRAAGGSPALAAIIGSVAAAAEARRLGNAVIGAADLRAGLRRILESRLAVAGTDEPQVVWTRDQLRIAHA